MHSLSRRVGESVINRDDAITLLGVKGDQVRIGINAPKALPGTHETVYERTKAEARYEHRSVNESRDIAWALVAKTASIARRDLYRTLGSHSGPHFETISLVCVAPDGTGDYVPRIATEDLPSRAQRNQQ